MAQLFARDAFEGKSVLITGGTSGIGAAAGKVFADAGASVMLYGRSVERGHAVRDEILQSGGTAEFFQGDVTQSSSADAAVAATVEKFGSLDILFANAGIFKTSSFVDTADADWQDVIDINLTGEFYFGRAAARQMIAQGRGGAIVNMASESGLEAFPATAAYGVANAGRVMLTKAMAADLSLHKIRVNVICPGDVDTPMHEAVWTGLTDLPEAEWREMAASVYPLGRVSTSEEIANVVAFLASDFASNMTGSVVSVDGGNVAVKGLPEGAG